MSRLESSINNRIINWRSLFLINRLTLQVIEMLSSLKLKNGHVLKDCVSGGNLTLSLTLLGK